MDKLNIISYNVSNDSIKQEEVLTVEIQFGTVNTSNVWVELVYNGEMVVRDTHLAESITKSLAGNDAHTEIFEVEPPFNAPNGIYELRIGADELSEAEYIILGKIQVGDKVEEIEPYTIKIQNLNIPYVIEKNVSAKVSADIDFSAHIDFDTTAYLSLWKDGLLYEVLEGKTKISCEIRNAELSVCLTSDLPEGEYEAKIGIHNIQSVTSETKIISVIGTDEVRCKYHKPMSYGNYFVKSTGREHFWYVNQFGALIWDGEPYVPFGGMFVPKYLRQYDANNPEVNKENFAQDKADLDELKAVGINDLYIGANIMLVTPTWAYKFFLDYLEKNGWKYGIQGDTRKNRRGSVYYPRANDMYDQFKVENVTRSGRVTLNSNMKFARSFDYIKNAVYVVVDNVTGNIITSGVSEISKNSDNEVTMSADVVLTNNINHTVYFSPEVFQDLCTVSNFWTCPEKTYDFIGKVFSRLETGDGFRFIVDLLNNESGVYNEIERGRFSDDAFNEIFAEWLEKRYKSITSLNKFWKCEPEILNFKEASGLIPVYTLKNSSITYFVNLNSGKGYKVDTRKGLAWNDYLDARDELYLEFMNKSSDMAKSHLNVPQIYKHVSVQRKYFINKNTVGGFDGIGSEAYESVDTVANQFAITSSLNNQFARTAWNLVTETNNHENIMGKYESGQWSYESKEDMFLRFNMALDLGMKGIFDFLLADRPDIDGKLGMAYSWIINKHVIEWASEYKKMLGASEFISEIVSRRYKDEVYYYFPPNKNWWIKPNERGIVQLEDDSYPFKRLKTERGIHILSTEDLDVDTKLIFINLNNGPLTKVYGAQLSKFLNEKHTDKRVCVLGHRNDIGSIPEIDKYFTSEKIVINNGNETVQILTPTSTCSVIRETDDGKVWALKDGNLYIVATDSFETSVGEFGTLHYVDDLGITNFD